MPLEVPYQAERLSAFSNEIKRASRDDLEEAVTLYDGIEVYGRASNLMKNELRRRRRTIVRIFEIEAHVVGWGALIFSAAQVYLQLKH